jgi:hypothetical protein
MGLVPCAHARAAQGGGWSVGKRAVGGPPVPLLLPNPTFPLLSPLFNLTANCPLHPPPCQPTHPCTHPPRPPPTHSKSPHPPTLYSFLASSWKKSCARAAMRGSLSSRHTAILAMWPLTCGSEQGRQRYLLTSTALPRRSNARWSRRHCPLPALHWHCYVLTPTTRRPLPLPTNTTGGP